ncbi:MAG: long-chain N-acyl amino acid synthase [Pirellulales bacterium]|nr:long-chain N-acyl amino acid synthase [Pirellulales bacterium]
MSVAELPASAIRSTLCPDVMIKVAANRREREGAFGLIYRSYLRAKLCRPNPTGMRITPYHLLESTDVIIAQLRGETISTLSLVRDGELGLPLEQIYPEVVRERRQAGLRLAEVSSLADRREEPARFFGLFCELSRLMVQMAHAEGVDQLLIAVHPRHARMYCRAMGFEQVGGNRDYPAVNGNPAVALQLDLAGGERAHPVLWKKFIGETLPPQVARSRPMDTADRRYFEMLAQQYIHMADASEVVLQLPSSWMPAPMAEPA